ncbi:MAG: hypothetical protein J6B09_08520 [Clostridia bacterium]|nr:hypothetical protein [Clostridia bacterium]MBQ8716475.1 hypothetical protein [Clostridia bacterium]
MIKGCQREMIVMQTQDSTLFESAYFILRRQRVPPSKQDMVAEANRIIGVGSGYLAGKRKKGRRLWLFALGFACGALLAAFFILLLYT